MSFLLIAIASGAYAQKKKKNRYSRDYWPSYRHTAQIAIGGNHFYGDVFGGPYQRPPFPEGFQPDHIRYTLSATYKYKFAKRWNVRASISYARVSAADSLNQGRQQRNLHFRSPIIEFSPLIEFYVLPENFPSRVRWGRWMTNRKPKTNFSWYFASGISVFYYDPQAQFQDNWYALRPLGTEGQGLDGSDPYSEVSIAIPAIMGFQIMVNQKWSFGFETGLRYALTDYIDDVSTDYYDADVLRAVNGPLAAELSDRNLTNRINEVGTSRGNPSNNDAYLFSQITISRKILKRRKRNW